MDDPPPYEKVASKSSNKPKPAANNDSQHLSVPGNGIPTSARRSMEDEGRPLPDGWVRQYDSQHGHQFFVDTKSTPPRSIWHHPYEDEDYLKTLTSEERERLQEEKTLSMEGAESSADEDGKHQKSKPPSQPPRKSSQAPSATQGRPSTSAVAGVAPAEPHSSFGKFGRKMKDKMTQSTHEEREAERKRRAEEEERAYRAHQAVRKAMSRAAETGQPQLLGKDERGKDVYVEPPPMPMGGMYGGGGRGYSQPGSYGYNPYTNGPYANPNARFVPYPTPRDPYNRPYGGGFGGGMGLPLMGGLLGGLLLGDLLF